MHLRTFTTIAAVTTTVSALAAPPHGHQAVAVIGPEVTQPPSIRAFRPEPRPKVVNAAIKKRDSDDDEIPDADDIDVPSDGTDGYGYPAYLSTSLKPLYTSCALAYESLITSAPQPTGKLEDWMEDALDDDMAWMSASTSDDPYRYACGTFKNPLTPPASLASSYSAFTSATASYLSARQPEVTSLEKACSAVYYDVVFSMLMPYTNYEQCTSRWQPYYSVYHSLACEENTHNCDGLTDDLTPKTTGAGAGNAGDATTTAAAASSATGASSESGGAAAGASSTSASGNAGAPKQTFAAAAALAGFVAAVAAL